MQQLKGFFSMFSLQGNYKQCVKAVRHDGHIPLHFSSMICLMRWQSCFPSLPVHFTLHFLSGQTQVLKFLELLIVLRIQDNLDAPVEGK